MRINVKRKNCNVNELFIVWILQVTSTSDLHDYYTNIEMLSTLRVL